MMSSDVFILDTNAWLAYLLNTEGPQRPVTLLVRRILAMGGSIAMTASIRKDVYYIACHEIKRLWHSDHPDQQMNDDCARLVRNVAWSLLDEMDEIATVVPVSMREDFLARHLRDSHDDYEDDLLIGTARAIKARMIVTYDKDLIAHFPTLCVQPAIALEKPYL